MEGEPPKREGRWKTSPATLDSAAVLHIPEQIAGMRAARVPASSNEVQMHQVSAAPHHLKL